MLVNYVINDIKQLLIHKMHLYIYSFLLQMDTYSNSTNYQFLNMDRQFSNRYSGLYIHLNNFYRQVGNLFKKEIVKVFLFH